MIELNLLPDIKKEFIRAQRMRNTVITASILTTVVAAGLLALLGMSVYGGQALYISNRTGEIKKAQAELSSIPEIDKYLTVQNQLNHIDSLHGDKLVYSRGFDFLQRLNPAQPNNVALSRLTIDKEDSSMTIEGTARDFHAINVFQTTLQSAEMSFKADGEDEGQKKPLFSEVTLTDTGLASVEGATLSRFEFRLVLADEAFLGTTRDIKINIPNVTTSDADRNAPRLVFGDKPEGN